MGLIIITALLGKKRHLKLYNKVVPMAFAFCEGTLFIMLFTLSVKNIEKYVGVLAIISILITATIIITLHKFGIYKNYQYPSVIICRAIMYIILIAYSLYCFITLEAIDNGSIVLVWMILCYIEYICIEKKDTTRIACVTLHTKNGKKITKDKIIQYEEDKVGYKLLDGREEILDENEIETITYQRKHLFCKYYKPKHIVECQFRDGNISRYQGYRLIRASWVSFFKIEKGIEDVLILKIKDTERITEL